MGNIALNSQFVDKKKLRLIIASIIIIASVIFGYFYWKNLNPTELIPLGDVTDAPEFKLAIYGDEKNGLELPLALTEYKNEVYISDSESALVMVFNLNGKLLRTIGDTKGAGKLNHPYGLVIRGNDLYVADGGWGKIMIFSTDGQYKGDFKPQGKETIVLPGAIALHDDHLLVCDLALNKVFIYDFNGRLLQTVGQKGDKDGQLDKPHGVAVDSKGNFYIADANNNRVQVFDKSGKFKFILGKDSKVGANKDGSLGTPRGVVVDNKDNILVAAGIENLIYVFDSEGNGILNFGKTNEQNGEISLPSGLYLSDSGRLYICETGNHRVSVFSY